MANHPEKFDSGLIVANPKIFLPWRASKDEILALTNEIQIVREDYYTLKVSLLDIPFVEYIGLDFEGNRLSKIRLLYQPKNTMGGSLLDIFNSHQTILEQCFGKPPRQSTISRFFTQMNKGDVEYRWQFKRVTVIHKIWDRFGLQEDLEIHIK